MIKIKKAIVHQYKSFCDKQSLTVFDDMTFIKGKNEAGKTNLLEVLAKSNYYDQTDEKFMYHTELDFPRSEKQKLDQQEESPLAVSITYQVDEKLINKICAEMECEIESPAEFTISTNYKGQHIMEASLLKKNKINEPLNEAIYRKYLKPNIPRFIYYDAYDILPARLNLYSTVTGWNGEKMSKTEKALLMLAGIGESTLRHQNMENVKNILETMEADFNKEFHKYWTDNKDISINFEIQEKSSTKIVMEERKGFLGRVKEVEVPVEEKNMELCIRIKNNHSMISIPLDQRSRGFQYFFSFWVWFRSMKECAKVPYVLLLDELGEGLSETAQIDLLRFLGEISQRYQILFTSHSAEIAKYMEERTIVLETDAEGRTEIKAADS